MILSADPRAGYLAYKDAIDRAVHEVLDSGWNIMGDRVRQFKKHFSEYLHYKQAGLDYSTHSTVTYCRWNLNTCDEFLHLF